MHVMLSPGREQRRGGADDVGSTSARTCSSFRSSRFASPPPRLALSHPSALARPCSGRPSANAIVDDGMDIRRRWQLHEAMLSVPHHRPVFAPAANGASAGITSTARTCRCQAVRSSDIENLQQLIHIWEPAQGSTNSATIDDDSCTDVIFEVLVQGINHATS